MLIAAVGRQREQVQREPGPAAGQHHRAGLDLAGHHRAEQGLSQALRPELLSVGHVLREGSEIRVMPNVITCLLSYHLERGSGDVDDPARLDPGQPLEQVAGALEPRAHGHGIELPGGGRTVPRLAGHHDTARPGQDQRFELIHFHGHHGNSLPSPRSSCLYACEAGQPCTFSG